ncbi:carbamoyltransferase [Sulfurimonas sp. CS5]|uniref:carbamoyltransferase family protein n=1 Tax=Sulfurimonas sp. CS5 TaxID=3391145 RepID=UPI0039EB7DFE
MYILGISAFYHDSAATLIKDGEIIAAAQEERFTRIKQDASFPKNAIAFCLDNCNINLDDIEKIVFYDDPKLKFKRILTTYVDFFPKSILFIFKSLPIWLTKKLYWKQNLINDFKINFKINIDESKILNTTHHRSHAASAFFASPYEDSAVLVLDGVGEFETTTLWHGKKNKLTQIKNLKFPHSIGLLYSAITYYTGFKVNSGEYKVMGLAPYGEPKYVETIKNSLITINENGTFKLDMSYFDFATGSKMTNDKFHKLFGQEPREEETEIGQFEMDMARSIQDVAEEVMLKLSNYIKEETKSDNLCLAGGVALNCVGNGKILKANIFKHIWIQPAAGDAGGSLGAALNYYFDILENKRIVDNKNDSMKGSYLGPEFSEQDIESYLNSIDADFIKYDNINELIEVVSTALSEEKIIGWHQGKMEFGPRSLGGRSILGDPRSQEMQKTMNLKIKYRESFRPFAPSVLREKVSDYFELDVDSPYMLLVAPINKSMIIKMSDNEEKLFGIEKLNIKRSTIPAVTHVDYSARVQTVHSETNPKYHMLLESFYKKTGCPVLVNTSFNVRGEPIVCTPEDSYRCFMRTEMDMLVINNYVMLKNKQPNYQDKGNWQEEFKLD